MVWIGGIRGFLLEHGVPVRQGHRFLRQQLPQILATRADVLSPRIIRIIADLIEDWKYLDDRIARVTDEIEIFHNRGCGKSRNLCNRRHRPPPLSSPQHGEPTRRCRSVRFWSFTPA